MRGYSGNGNVFVEVACLEKNIGCHQSNAIRSICPAEVNRRLARRETYAILGQRSALCKEAMAVKALFRDQLTKVSLMMINI